MSEKTYWILKWCEKYVGYIIDAEDALLIN